MSSALVDQLDAAVGEMARLIAGVREGQWLDPTPCSEWSVGVLVEHVISGNRLVARVLTGEEPADSAGAPVDAFRASANAVVRAFSVPEVLERTVELPVGMVPGTVALHLRLTEMLVHGWDLARATGQRARFDDDLAEQELRFSRDALAMVPSDRRPFDPEQPVAASEPALEHLAALLGRSVGHVDLHG